LLFTCLSFPDMHNCKHTLARSNLAHLKNSLTRQSALLISAGLFALAAIWRAIIAIQHYRFSRTIIDDPSMRELEQLGAFFEAGACLILLLHAAVLAVYSRQTLKIFWPLVAVTGTNRHRHIYRGGSKAERGNPESNV
jgi:hypothetical protein